MTISDYMGLDQLAERVTDHYDVSSECLMQLRDLLVARYDGRDTGELTDAEWQDAINQIDWIDSAMQALHDAGFQVGERIEAGEGDDREAGVILAAESQTMCLVAWESGVRTRCDISAMELA